MASPLERAFVGRGPTVPAGAALSTQAAFYTDGSESLRVSSVCSVAGVTIAVTGRVRNPDGSIGRFRQTHSPNSDRTLKSNVFSLAEGYVLNVSVVAETGSVSIGNCWVQVQVMGGYSGATIVLGTLLQGYVTTTQHLAWPGSPLVTSLDGLPYRRIFALSALAAGIDWSFGPGAGRRWSILSIRAVLAAGVTGTARSVILLVSTPSGISVAVPPAATHPDTAIYTYMWAANLPVIASPGTAILQQALPAPTIVLSGEVVVVQTVGLGGSDQWQGTIVVVDEWLEVQ